MAEAVELEPARGDEPTRAGTRRPSRGPRRRQQGDRIADAVAESTVVATPTDSTSLVAPKTRRPSPRRATEAEPARSAIGEAPLVEAAVGKAAVVEAAVEKAVVGKAVAAGFRDLLGQAVGVRLDEVTRAFAVGDFRVEAVRKVSLEIVPGEFVAIIGPSGCGKSTLLGLIGGLDRPTSGHVYAAGAALDQLSDRALADYRLQRVGTVFQNFNLVPSRTAVENVALPLALAGLPASEQRSRAARLLDLVGLTHRASFRTARLAGGEQQRVALARALASRPGLILADEPTGSLDSANGAQVLELLENLHRRGATLVLVTHDPDVAARADRVVHMRDGQVVGDQRQARRRTKVAPHALEEPSRLSSREALRIGLDAVGRRPLRTALTAAGAALGMALTSLVLSLGAGAGLGRATAFLGLIALVVAGVGIVNTMYTSVVDRTREVGVLKALGARFEDVALIFVAEAVVIGLAAGFLGAGASVLLAEVGNRIAGAEAFRSGGVLAIITIGLAVVLSLVSGLPPALRAARQDPMRALRSE